MIIGSFSLSVLIPCCSTVRARQTESSTQIGLFLALKMLQCLFLWFSIVLMTAQTATCEISLSPATWPQGEYERLERMTLSRFERPKPLAVSDGKGLVAGTTEPLAVHSGMDALRKGGNAMDACLATALTGTNSVKTGPEAS